MKYVIAVLLGGIPFFVSGATITDYYVDIKVQDNADLFVSEQVEYVLESDELLDEIEHTIGLRYSLISGERQSMMITNARAFVNEQELEVDFTIDEKQASIKVLPKESGFEENTKLELTYTVIGAIAYYEQYNQIYWPTFTSEAQSVINLVAGSVRIPSVFTILRAECVVVREGKEYRCNVPPRLEGGYVSYFAHMGTEQEDEVFLDVQFDTGVEVTVRSVSWSYGEWFLVMLGTLCTLGMLAVAFVYFRIRIQEYFSASPKKSENKSKK